MGRLIALLYGVVAYVGFLATFLYAIGFVHNIFVPKAIDVMGAGESLASFWNALIINVLLLGIFAVQHSIMARPAFKTRWTKIISPAVERSTYVMITNVILWGIFCLWRVMPDLVWVVENETFALILNIVAALGWLMVLTGSFMINHFDLFGLRQVWLNFKGAPYTPVPFKIRGLYKLVRHPLMTGFFLAFWATPVMSEGHLLFALLTSGYILIALYLEEHDLEESLGDDYTNYKKRVGKLIPGIK